MGSLFSAPKIRTSATKKAVTAIQQSVHDPIKFPELADRALHRGTEAARSLQPTGFSAGGLTSAFSGNTLSLTSDADRKALIEGLSKEAFSTADRIAALRGRVAPGMSELRSSRLQEIENARRSSIGNLRDNLARRRVLGSSFGADAETRAEIEFAQQKERVAAESFLQEIDLTNQFIGEEFTARQQGFSTRISELNLQADLASNLTAQATDTFKASAQLQTQLALQEATLRTQLGISTADNRVKAAIGAGELQAGISTNQAKLDAGAQAGTGKLIGTIGSIALAPATGGLSLAALPAFAGSSLPA